VLALGGLHAMADWPGPIVTDSGGFQAYSLIRQNAKYGSLTDNGLVYRPEGGKDKLLLTPEKCIQLQLSYGADVLMCLDDCTHVDDPPAAQAASVQRTVKWAARCQREFERLVEEKRLGPAQRPRLFAVIQGGGLPELRRACADALLAIGFDGYGYGGWPLDADGKLVVDMLAYTRELVPAALPMHALGVGHPANVAACARLGYGLFDSALPTRDARRGRLYLFNQPPAALDPAGDGWFNFLYIKDDKHIKDARPLSEHCDCLVCRHYARGYLHHLFQVGDAAYLRLATLHNLRFMTTLMARLQSPAATGHGGPG
jgi:queuine tRNA-ribosyltransferase